jgi:hypothetical protein
LKPGDLPESERVESIADTDNTGDGHKQPQNRLRDVLEMPVLPRQTYPVSTVGAPSIRSERDDASSARLSPPASLYELHVADFPRIHRFVPRRGRLMSSTSPRIFKRPGTAPVPSGPERAVSPQPASSGPDLDLVRRLQDKRRQRRSSDRTFIPIGDKAGEEYMVRLIDFILFDATNDEN